MHTNTRKKNHVLKRKEKEVSFNTVIIIINAGSSRFNKCTLFQQLNTVFYKDCDSLNSCILPAQFFQLFSQHNITVGFLTYLTFETVTDSVY